MQMFSLAEHQPGRAEVMNLYLVSKNSEVLVGSQLPCWNINLNLVVVYKLPWSPNKLNVFHGQAGSHRV